MSERPKMDALDEKRTAAWLEIAQTDRDMIRFALANPQPRVGAVMPIGATRRIKTTLGFVVWDGFVTPLALALIEAVDFNRSKAE